MLAVVEGGAPLAAHHSFAAEFDGPKPVTLKGTVTRMEWTNPHAWLHVDVKGPDGKVVSWEIWTPPRTPDGQPDLQGIWTNYPATPFEIPDESDTPEFYAGDLDGTGAARVLRPS